MLSKFSRMIAYASVAFCIPFVVSVNAQAASTQAGIDTPNTSLPFAINGTQVMLMMTTGLGIGTSPSYALDVASGNTIVARFLSTSASNSWIEVGNATTTSNWGIGQNIPFPYIYSANGSFFIGGDGITPNPPTFYVAGMNGGRVGIDTTNPSANFEVSGTSQFDGNVTISNASNPNLSFIVNGSMQSNGAVIFGGLAVDNLGGASGNITAQGTVTAMAFYHSSDQRLKVDIRPIPDALDKLLALKGVQFNWKSDGRPDMGVVAQNVAAVFPDVVKTGSNGMMSVEYDSLVGPMIEAIRELKSENDDLRKTVSQIDQLKAQLHDVNDAVISLQAKQKGEKAVALDGMGEVRKTASP